MIEQISHPQSEPQSLVQMKKMYEVEAIRDKKKFKYKGKIKDFYLIKWLGYPEEKNTWEPYQNLAQLDEIILEFQRTRNESKINEENQQQKEQKTDKINKQSIKSIPKQSVQREKQHKYQTKQQKQVLRNKNLKKNVSQAISNKKDQTKSNQLEKKVERKKKKSQKTKESPAQMQILTNPQNPLKRRNPFVPMQSTSATDVEKNTIKKYGKIVNHIYKDGLIYYQVEKLNHEAKVVGTQLKTGSVVRQECSIYQYLQKYLIQCQQYNRSLQK